MSPQSQQVGIPPKISDGCLVFGIRGGIANTQCHAIVLAGRKSGFRAGFWPDFWSGKLQNQPSGRPKTGRRADLEAFPIIPSPVVFKDVFYFVVSSPPGFGGVRTVIFLRRSWVLNLCAAGAIASAPGGPRGPGLQRSFVTCGTPDLQIVLHWEAPGRPTEGSGSPPEGPPGAPGARVTQQMTHTLCGALFSGRAS